MGIFDFLKRKKYEKIKREEVVDAIIKLEKERESAETRLENYQGEIDTLLTKGKAAKDRQIQLLYAKKINEMKARRQNDYNRILFLMYNERLLDNLKQAIDDNSFVASVGGMQLNQLLGDQKGLSMFLNKALGRKVRLEDMMTSADDVFKDVAIAYEPNEKIYGASESDDALLAMFETEESLNDEMSIAEAEQQKIDKKIEENK